MWNGGLFLIMNHINDMILEGQVCGLQPLPKIIYEHAYLTPYSVMNVRLAAQVLSTTVSKVLSNYGPADAAGTAEQHNSIVKSIETIQNINFIN